MTAQPDLQTILQTIIIKVNPVQGGQQVYAEVNGRPKFLSDFAGQAKDPVARLHMAVIASTMQTLKRQYPHACVFSAIRPAAMPASNVVPLGRPKR